MAEQHFHLETKPSSFQFSIIRGRFLGGLSDVHFSSIVFPPKMVFKPKSFFSWNLTVKSLFLDASWDWGCTHVSVELIRSCSHYVCVAIFLMMKLWSIMHDQIRRLMLFSLTYYVALMLCRESFRLLHFLPAKIHEKRYYRTNKASSSHTSERVWRKIKMNNF